MGWGLKKGEIELKKNHDKKDAITQLGRLKTKLDGA